MFCSKSGNILVSEDTLLCLEKEKKHVTLPGCLTPLSEACQPPSQSFCLASILTGSRWKEQRGDSDPLIMAVVTVCLGCSSWGSRRVWEGKCMSVVYPAASKSCARPENLAPPLSSPQKERHLFLGSHLSVVLGTKTGSLSGLEPTWPNNNSNAVANIYWHLLWYVKCFTNSILFNFRASCAENKR